MSQPRQPGNLEIKIRVLKQLKNRQERAYHESTNKLKEKYDNLEEAKMRATLKNHEVYIPNEEYNLYMDQNFSESQSPFLKNANIKNDEFSQSNGRFLEQSQPQKYNLSKQMVGAKIASNSSLYSSLSRLKQSQSREFKLPPQIKGSQKNNDWKLPEINQTPNNKYKCLTPQNIRKQDHGQIIKSTFARYQEEQRQEKNSSHLLIIKQSQESFKSNSDIKDCDSSNLSYSSMLRDDMKQEKRSHSKFKIMKESQKDLKSSCIDISDDSQEGKQVLLQDDSLSFLELETLPSTSFNFQLNSQDTNHNSTMHNTDKSSFFNGSNQFQLQSLKMKKEILSQQLEKLSKFQQELKLSQKAKSDSQGPKQQLSKFAPSDPSSQRITLGMKIKLRLIEKQQQKGQQMQE